MELAAAFAVGDANSDGYLDPAEFEAAKAWLEGVKRGQDQHRDDGRGSHGH